MRSALPPRVCDLGHRIQFPLMLRRWRGGPRNYPHNGDDFDVIGPDEKIIGRVMKPGGACGTSVLGVEDGGSPAAARLGHGADARGGAASFRADRACADCRGKRPAPVGLLAGFEPATSRSVAGRSRAFRSAELQEHSVDTREGIEPSEARLQRATSPLGHLVVDWQNERVETGSRMHM